MKHLQCFKPIGQSLLRKASLTSAVMLSALLLACGGGGGGGGGGLVTGVNNAQVLEGNDGQTSLLEFEVALDKPTATATVLTYSTDWTDKPSGYAKGGSACAAGIDFISVSNGTVSIAAGSSSGKIAVTVCGDAVFEPHKVFTLNWTASAGVTGSAVGTIVNDDAGGLSGTGSTTLLTGLSAYGRDSNPLTNDAADGALGFSFDKTGACVIDKVSGLTWEKGPFVAKVYADLGAHVAAVNASSPCGHSDWRVPTANELLNLMDISKVTGEVANADHLGVAADAMTGQFWSSEVTATSPTINAWYADTDSNGVLAWDGQSTSKNVRLVRGGAAAAAVCNNNDGRFTLEDGGATVSDSRTGLMWKTCPEGTSGASCATGAHLQFSTAADVVSRLASANSAANHGYSDWRVPTRNELASLVNRACSSPSPAILSAVFPRNDAFSYISANVEANAPGAMLWTVDFFDGNVGISPWSTSGSPRSYLLRLVRAGQ